MKAVYVKAPYTFEVRGVNLRSIRPNEALIKIKACGICGTDLHMAGTEAKEWQSFGHEITGIVEEVGSNVMGIKVNDHVLLESGSFCRECATCRNGRVDLCNNAPNIFKGDTMGFAEYIIAPKECLVPFSGIGFDEATLIEPLGVALDLVYTADIKLNEDVLVIGLGPIGLMAMKLAKAAGARNIYCAARSASKARIKLAKELGATDIIFTDKNSLEEYDFPRGGVDKIMVTAPPRTIPSALKVANIGGTVAFLGIEYGEGAVIAFDANEFHFKKLQLKASYAAPALWFPRCLELIESGIIDPKVFITHRFGLEQTGEFMLKARDDKANAIKMVMVNDCS